MSERLAPEMQARRVQMAGEMKQLCSEISEKLSLFFNQKSAELTSAANSSSNLQCETGAPSVVEPTWAPAKVHFQNMWNSAGWEQQMSRHQWVEKGRAVSKFQFLRRKTHDAYVSGIPWKWGASEIFQMFRSCGKIAQILLPSGFVPGTHRGFGFVRFEKPKGLENAVQLIGRKVEEIRDLIFESRRRKTERLMHKFFPKLCLKVQKDPCTMAIQKCLSHLVRVARGPSRKSREAHWRQKLEDEYWKLFERNVPSGGPTLWLNLQRWRKLSTRYGTSTTRVVIGFGGVSFLFLQLLLSWLIFSGMNGVLFPVCSNCFGVFGFGCKSVLLCVSAR